MRQAFWKNNGFSVAAVHLKCTSIARSALVTRSAQTSSHETPWWLGACVLALDATWRWALAQHPTSFSQPGHITQRAVGPRWPEEPLAQLSWASSPRHRRRSCTGICDQACGHAVARLSPSRCTSVARQRGACLPDERLLNGEGRGTTHLVADACATAPALPW